jgi:hypothetical protein
MAAYTVGLVAEHGNTPREQEAREQLAEVLDDAELSPIEDDTGVFEVELEADSQDDAIQRVIDAIAEAAVDDHIRLAEHTPPDV